MVCAVLCESALSMLCLLSVLTLIMISSIFRWRPNLPNCSYYCMAACMNTFWSLHFTIYLPAEAAEYILTLSSGDWCINSQSAAGYFNKFCSEIKCLNESLALCMHNTCLYISRVQNKQRLWGHWPSWQFMLTSLWEHPEINVLIEMLY